MDRKLKRTSKFLSLILRHRPESIGLSLNEGGWASISELLDAAAEHGNQIDHSLLLHVVHENDKQRFAISADGLSIRANQGHSVDVDLGLKTSEPPETLFHGTVVKFLEGILQQGLIPGSRQHVHLSSDEKTARIVGQRRGKPLILRVAAAQMATDGMTFFLSENGVWLTDHVPVQYIELP